MNTRNSILGLIILAVVIFAAGYVFTRSQPSEPFYTLIETGDRQHKENEEFYTVQVNYPDKTPLATRGERGSEEKALRTIESEMKNLIEEFKEMGNVQNLPEEEKARLKEAQIKYSLNVGYRPYSSGSFVSYEFNIFMDTGGAHPNSFFKTLVFDLKGNEVKLEDLFTSNDYLNRISQMAQAQVTAQLSQRVGAEATSSIIAEGIAPKEENFENFVVDSDRLRIFIPPYQAAAYAAGSFEVQVPLIEVRDILKEHVR